MKLNIKEKKNKSNIEMSFNLPASPVCIGEVRERILGACKYVCIVDEEAQDICLAIIEAVTNAIRHSGCEKLDVLFMLSKKRMLAKVVDEGKGFLFSERNCSFPDIESPGGRGLPIICSLVDDLTVDSGMNSGTTITMVKYLGGKRESA